MARRSIRRYFRLTPGDAEEVFGQVDDEIALHIDLRTQELIARGLEPSAARREAERQFGPGISRDSLRRRAHVRARRTARLERVAGWLCDFRFAVRSLGREPLMATMVVLTLALGIGANATVFGLIDPLLLRGPAHVEAPETVRRIHVAQPEVDGRSVTSATVPYAAGSVMRELDDVFSTAGVYRYGPSRIGRGEGAVEDWVGWATPDLFPLLGVSPVLGRFFTAEEDAPGAARRVAVLEYGYWQSRFGGAEDAIGRTVVVDGEAFTVIGVAPRGFTGPEHRPARLWVPFSTGYEPTPDWVSTWSARWAHVLVRIRDGVSEEQAASRAAGAYRAALLEAGGADASMSTVRLLPATYTDAGSEPPEVAVSRWLMVMALMVLLVAWANVTNLLLARALRRQTEFGIRLALGIPMHRLARLLFTEGFVLAAAGGVLAIGVASVAGVHLRRVLMPDAPWDTVVAPRTLAFVVAATVCTGIVVSLAPVIRTARHDLSRAFRSSRARSGAERSRVRPALASVQAALALVLLVNAGHFVRSLWNVHRMDLGIDVASVLVVEVEFQADGTGPGAWADLSANALERLRARPDVAAVAIASATPMSGATMGYRIWVPGRDSLPRLPGGGPYATGVSEGYFEAVGTRIIRGRGIESGDDPESGRVLVINKAMAEALWSGRDPIGQCVHLGSSPDAPCFRVVGIAEDTHRHALIEEPAMQYYVPLARGGGGQILVRPAGHAASFVPALRSAMHGIEPRLEYVHIASLNDLLAAETRPWRVGAMVFLVSGALALAVAATGLYSIVAYLVRQRRHEIGIRLTLGAKASDVVIMVARWGLTFVVLGLAVGTPLAMIVSQRLEILLFRTDTSDPLTFAAAALVIVSTAAAALIAPALRAGRIEPLEAIRSD